MQNGDVVAADENDLDSLRQLELTLRMAIVAAFDRHLPHVAVALDTTRDFVASVLAEDNPRVTRVALARVRAEMALERWRHALLLPEGDSSSAYG